MSEVIAAEQTPREIMDPLPGNANDGIDRTETYLWELPEKGIAVRCDLDVVDRMLAEVLRGFGVIPKRGIEIGGVLLGEYVAPGVVHVTDYETVACQHSRGSSYLLSPEETQRLRGVCDRWLSNGGGRSTVIGLFRSHTREGFHLTVEDVDLLDRMVPDPAAVMLLVKPYATRVSMGGFFFREDGGIRKLDTPYLEFPFRRRELAGEGPEPAAPAPENGVPAAEPPSTPPAPASDFSFGGYNQGNKAVMTQTMTSEQTYGLAGAQVEAAEGGQRKRSQKGWVWIPLSFIFLLLGVVLGFQVALSVGSKLPSGLRPPDPFAMNLVASPSGNSVHVRWDRNAPAIQNAPRGVLHIQDGNSEQRVDLDALQLLNGSVIYNRRAAQNVKFRLEVFTTEKVSLSETVQFTAP